jgi:Cu+-exporting ATPase
MCAQSIEEALEKREGVVWVDVNFATEKAIIEYDDKKVSLDELEKDIQEIGSEPIIIREENERREVILQILGMHCAACAITVEKALNTLEGVDSVVVNLATEKARVKYDSRMVSLLDLRQAVRNTGYEVDEEEEVYRSIEERARNPPRHCPPLKKIFEDIASPEAGSCAYIMILWIFEGLTRVRADLLV